jgi:hypothetical protein
LRVGIRNRFGTAHDGCRSKLAAAIFIPPLDRVSTQLFAGRRARNPLSGHQVIAGPLRPTPPYFPVKPKRRMRHGHAGAQSSADFGRARSGLAGGSAPRSAGGGCKISGRCGTGAMLAEDGCCAEAEAAENDIAASSAAAAAAAWIARRIRAPSASPRRWRPRIDPAARHGAP